MNVNMHGKKAKRIFFIEGGNISSNDEHTLQLSATYHGDRDEFWICVFQGDTEISRHNCRSIETIEWK